MKPHHAAILTTLAAAAVGAAWINGPFPAHSRQIAAVHASGLTGKRPDAPREYQEAQEEFAQKTIAEFLSTLSLPQDAVTSELNRIEVALKKDGCLARTTITSIHQSLLAGCATIPEDDLILAIILASFYNEDQAVRTLFYPYGLNRLRKSSAPIANIIQYIETLPLMGSRQLTECLIMLSFLNLYWDTVKDHQQLSPTEYTILFKPMPGFAFAASQQNNCVTLANEANQLSLAARKKHP
jgi:hypothetical protein